MKILIIFTLLLVSCNIGGSEVKQDCYAQKDYYNPDRIIFHCPDGSKYSSNMAAGIEDGDIVDLETEVNIVDVK